MASTKKEAHVCVIGLDIVHIISTVGLVQIRGSGSVGQRSIFGISQKSSIFWDIDTRALTSVIRDKGPKNVMLCSKEFFSQNSIKDIIKKINSYKKLEEDKARSYALKKSLVNQAKKNVETMRAKIDSEGVDSLGINSIQSELSSLKIQSNSQHLLF